MTDPVRTPLGAMLLDEITPVVMVLGTPLVEEACLKNDLSFVDMLSPFCDFDNIDVPVRTASDQSYRLQKFRLRLFYASDVRPPNWEVAKERLNQVVTQAEENNLSYDTCSDPLSLNNLDSGSELGSPPLWFHLFNKEHVRSASFSDHEAFDYPVACLMVVSSKDEQPINQFVDLFNPNKLPSLLNDGAMDPKILKHYLLLHDNQDGEPEKAAKTLTEMRNTFGSDCQLLCMNSSQDVLVDAQENPWALHKSTASSGKNLGCFLSVDDINEMKDFMQDLSTKQIIPYMEQKIRELNQQVSATRKGFKNQIKNLWWRKGKDEIPDTSNGQMYTFNSNESQIRVLGDYAFMLRDYELALSNYRLISTDYKLDKAWKRYAGVQEVMGLAYFLSDQSRKEAEYCMENAFTTYLKLGPPGKQNATRCGLWWAEMLKTRDQFQEAATVYFRCCSSEEPLHSAVMLEQASFCYLSSKPPMLHKYGFHLVLSGERYKNSDKIKHAIRTYENAITVYKDTTWSHIKDHVHFNIGQWYALLGKYDLAVSHVLEVLACTHQAKTTQEIFLRHFLQIVQKAGKTVEVPKLKLPEINIASLKLIFEDYRTYASPAAASVEEIKWRSLEEDLLPSMSTSRGNWLELYSKQISRKNKESNICVAGEVVRIDIKFKNPLQIPISVSSISLICELSTGSDETPSDSAVANKLTEASSRETSHNSSSCALSKVDLSLEGGEASVVQLTVTPRKEGILQIVGVRWNLSDDVVGFYNFESDPKKKKKKEKGRQIIKLSPLENLKFVVIKSQPKLEGSIHILPKSTYAGEISRLALELKNQSDCPVKNLKIKVSDPRFLSVGHEVSPKPGDSATQSSHSSESVFIFPEGTIIKAGTPLSWPLWFRAAVPGNVSLYITIYYEIEDASSTMKYRTLCMHHNVQVLPSLELSFQVNSCPSKLHEFLVQMDVVNRTNSLSFQVDQLFSVGKKWEISLLETAGVTSPLQRLMAGQALSCFLLLKNQEKSETSEDKTFLASGFVGNSVRLGSGDSAEPLSYSPLADFHLSERLHQEMPHQGDPTVDFVLVSRPLKGDPNSVDSDPPHLFSHHSCHCSIPTSSPISWLMHGPRSLYHDFSVSSLCEIKLSMTVHNSSQVAASMHVNTHSDVNNAQAGWQDVSTVAGTRPENPPALDSVAPFIWSASSSTRARVEPASTVEIPLQISVLSPGTYDLSNYALDWNLLSSNRNQSSGSCRGYPFYLTVLQSE